MDDKTDRDQVPNAISVQSTGTNENETQIETLSVQQQRAVELLAAGQTVAATARDLGVARETVSRWLNRNIAFATTLNRMRKELHRTHGDRLRALTGRAIDALEELLGPETPAALRFRVAISVIEATKAIEGEIGPTSPESVELKDLLAKLEYMITLLQVQDALDDREVARARKGLTSRYRDDLPAARRQTGVESK